MAEQSVEERLAQLETKVAELERQRGVQEDRDIAFGEVDFSPCQKSR